MRSVTAEDLLSRTVLYKVGHHGSHNATLREKGLELMTHPGLVAMIPTDEAWALEKKGWEMPYGDLAERLKEKTRGRVLRADTGAPEPTEVEASDRKEFLGRVREMELYVEYWVLLGS